MRPRDPVLRLLDEDPRTSESVIARRLSCHPVRADVDVFEARRGLRKEALTLGFSRIVAQELEIVASELCTNILKYGVRGELILDALTHERRGRGIAVSASDVGKPFTAFERAAQDRSDQQGTIPPDAMYGRAGIGGGLAAVRRLSDGIFLEQRPEGKTIVVVRYSGPPKSV